MADQISLNFMVTLGDEILSDSLWVRVLDDSHCQRDLQNATTNT